MGTFNSKPFYFIQEVSDVFPTMSNKFGIIQRIKDTVILALDNWVYHII